MRYSEAADFGDLSNQKVQMYTSKLSAAVLPSSLACLLRGPSGSTVQKEQLGSACC